MEQEKDSKDVGDAITSSTGSRAVGSIPERYGLDEDLVRFCLQPDRAESNRRLAWANSICLVYLLIGIFGLRTGPGEINRKAAVDEIVPTVIQPEVTPATQVTPDSGGEHAPNEPTEGDIVAVTVDSPAVAFSVPTVGNLLVPQSMAQAPPVHPMQGAVPISSAKIELIGVTGTGGQRPAPVYPYESLRDREQGTVVLLIEVGESGKATSVTVKQSSGYMRLDRAAADWVKRYWFFGMGSGARLYESPIIFRLE